MVRLPHLVAAKWQRPVVKTYRLFVAKVCLASAFRLGPPKQCVVRCKARWPALWVRVVLPQVVLLPKVSCAQANVCYEVAGRMRLVCPALTLVTKHPNQRVLQDHILLKKKICMLVQ